MTARTKTCIALLCLAFAAALVGLRTSRVLSDPEHQVAHHGGMRDFHNAVYYPAVALIDGVNPYDSEAYRASYPVRHFPLYSPVTLALHQPFGVLPRRLAEVAYFLLGITLSVVFARLVLEFCSIPAPAHRVLFLASGLLLSRPGQQNMMNGQSTLQVVIGVTLALRYGKERPWLAACGVALGSLKPTFGLPLVILMLARREYGALVRGLGISALIALSVLAYLASQGSGLGGLIDSFQANLAQHGEHPNTNLSTTYSRIDAVMLISRTTGWIPAMSAQFAIAFAVLAVGAVTVRHLGQAEQACGPGGLRDLLCVMSILLFLYHQSYDLLFLALPLAIVARSPRAPWNRLSPRVQGVLVLCLLAPLLNFAATASGLSILSLTGLAWKALTVLNCALMALVFSFGVWLAWRPGPASRA